MGDKTMCETILWDINLLSLFLPFYIKLGILLGKIQNVTALYCVSGNKIFYLIFQNPLFYQLG